MTGAAVLVGLPPNPEDEAAGLALPIVFGGDIRYFLSGPEHSRDAEVIGGCEFCRVFLHMTLLPSS